MIWASLVAQLVKNLPAMWETWVLSLAWEDPLEKRNATHSSILAWTIHSMGSQRVRHDWVTLMSIWYSRINGKLEFWSLTAQDWILCGPCTLVIRTILIKLLLSFNHLINYFVNCVNKNDNQCQKTMSLNILIILFWDLLSYIRMNTFLFCKIISYSEKDWQHHKIFTI